MEWTLTFPSELPLWELESQWTPKSLGSDCKGQNPSDWRFFYIIKNILKLKCRNATLAKCEDETHTPKVGDLESFRTPECLEFDSRGQNTSDWGVLDVVGKVLKCRCPKWPRIGHLDICSPSYGQKNGRESNWQFDSWPQKVGNRPLPDVCRWSVMRRWKALKESYNFGLDLTPIGGRSQELWVSKVPGVQPGTVSRLQLGSPGKKSHLDVAPAE
jgi:hypothetical protein